MGWFKMYSTTTEEEWRRKRQRYLERSEKQAVKCEGGIKKAEVLCQNELSFWLNSSINQLIIFTQNDGIFVLQKVELTIDER